MPSTSETGHAKNVANFEELISFCTGYGVTYNPSNTGISLSVLNTKRTQCLGALAALNSLIPALTNAINQREIVFAPLSKLVTRVYNALAASGASPQAIADAKTIVRKLQGRRATPKQPTVPDDPATPANESSKSISASQLSYDSQVENFSRLIELLTSIGTYTPNEADLTVGELTTLLNNLKTANSAVINATVPVSNARNQRNTVLYTQPDSLLPTAGNVKLYVKSIFGASSPQYKQVSKIKFTAIPV